MTADKAKLDADVDSVLDEIDGVLEANAGGVRPQLRPEGRAVTRADVGRLAAAFSAPGSSSFTEFLGALPLVAARTTCPAPPRRGPHGTTIVTLTHAGVWSWPATGGRWAISSPTATWKVFAADEFSVVGIARTAGLAIEVKLFQVELGTTRRSRGR